MKNETLAYIAGVMDSDGYFTIKRNTYHIRKIKDSKNPHYYERIGLKQVHKYAVQLIHKNFGGYFRIEKPSAEHGKPLYSIQLTNLKAHNLIKVIFPYLHIKKPQAQILFDLRESLKRGKTKKVKAFIQSRWGNKIRVTRYAVSEEEIILREQLTQRIKQLNDSRSDSTHQPIPWK